jgi:hypothetical protein
MRPVPERKVICLDERGPVRAQTYPGEVWQEGHGRAIFTPDDGRRGSIWGLGAFAPATLSWNAHRYPSVWNEAVELRKRTAKFVKIYLDVGQ